LRQRNSTLTAAPGFSILERVTYRTCVLDKGALAMESIRTPHHLPYRHYRVAPGVERHMDVRAVCGSAAAMLLVTAIWAYVLFLCLQIVGH
jgi:hypothetical protein